MQKKITEFVTTFCYVGYFPIASGSLASLVGVFLAFFLRDDIVAYIVVTVVITAFGFLYSGKMEKILNRKDPSCVVIDEVSGMMIALLLLPKTMPIMITAFFLFRAFDMFKIYPVYKFEKLEGGVGIMLDDVVAGLYTNIAMQIATVLVSIRYWF